MFFSDFAKAMASVPQAHYQRAYAGKGDVSSPWERPPQDGSEPMLRDGLIENYSPRGYVGPRFGSYYESNKASQTGLPSGGGGGLVGNDLDILRRLSMPSPFGMPATGDMPGMGGPPWRQALAYPNMSPWGQYGPGPTGGGFLDMLRQAMLSRFGGFGGFGGPGPFGGFGWDRNGGFMGGPGPFGGRRDFRDIFPGEGDGTIYELPRNRWGWQL
jgi:hypothetical protein